MENTTSLEKNVINSKNGKSIVQEDSNIGIEGKSNKIKTSNKLKTKKKKNKKLKKENKQKKGFSQEEEFRSFLDKEMDGFKENKKISKKRLDKIKLDFKSSKNFAELSEKISQPIDKIISRSNEIIKEDPVMGVSNEMEKINEEINEIYDDLVEKDGIVISTLKKIPGIKNIIDFGQKQKDKIEFQLKDNNEKLQHIFRNYDICNKSLQNNISAYKNMEKDLEEYIDNIGLYINLAESKGKNFEKQLSITTSEDKKIKLSEFISQLKFFTNNMKSLEAMLRLSMKRITETVKNATILNTRMATGKPIFSLLINLAVSESAGKKAVEASTKALEGMGSTIERMQSDLTDRTIESSKKTQKLLNSPIVSLDKIIENSKKLREHFEQLAKLEKEYLIKSEKDNQRLQKEMDILKKTRVLSQKNLESINKLN